MHNWNSTITYFNHFEWTCLVVCPRRNSTNFSAIVYTGSSNWMHLFGCPRNSSQCQRKWNIGKRCETALSYLSHTQTSDMPKYKQKFDTEKVEANIMNNDSDHIMLNCHSETQWRFHSFKLSTWTINCMTEYRIWFSMPKSDEWAYQK